MVTIKINIDVKEYCEKPDTLLCLFGNKVDKK